VVTISVVLDFRVLNLEATMSAHDAHPDQRRPWVSECEDIGLHLPRELLRLEHLGLTLQVLEDETLSTVDPIVSLDREDLNEVRDVLDLHLLADCVFL
jgi:hypothetical protein